MRLVSIIRSYVAPVVVVLACAVLISVSIHKALHLDAFVSTIRGQGLIPSGLVRGVAFSVPVVEAVVAILGLSWLLCSTGASKSLLLLCAFFLAMTGYALLLHLHPPAKPAGCGCGFSDAPVTDWLSIVIRNGSIASVLGGLSLLPSQRAAG